ncbi:hypothetical protein [Nocardia paucivorans]|nr:hypothetical protein [Nocardia paucivorans]
MTAFMNADQSRLEHKGASDPEPEAIWPDPSPLADWWAKVMRTGT